MPIRTVNGIDLSFDEYGSGEPVLMIAGTGGPGRIWKTYQVPALIDAGFRVITVDSRGVPPSDACQEGFTIDDVVADIAGLIEALGTAPARIVGFSLGAIVVQELLVAHPGLIEQAVLMATRGRTDPLSRASGEADLELFDAGIKLPPRYEAVNRVMQGFSPRTLNDEQTVRDWVDVFEMSPITAVMSRSLLALDLIPNRLVSYRGITAECLVLAFQDDLMARPYLCREVADHIPNGVYREIAGCGHYGFVEDPVAVNAAILDFFRPGGGDAR